MEDFVLALLALVPPSLWYIPVALCFASALFVALAPPALTAKIPNPIMVIINTLAINFSNASNELTDKKGNPKLVDKNEPTVPKKKA